MLQKKAQSIIITAALVAGIISGTTSVHAEDTLNKRPAGIKALDKLATKSGDVMRKVEDKLASRSEKLKERFETNSQRLENKFASLSAKQKEQRIKRLTTFSDNLIRKFTHATERQENILKRADVRIASYAAEGKNVTDLKAKSASVSAMIAKQKTSIAALKTTLQAVVSANSSSNDTVKNAVADVVKQVTATQKALQDLIRSIAKASPAKEKPSKSPSAQPTAAQNQ